MFVYQTIQVKAEPKKREAEQKYTKALGEFRETEKEGTVRVRTWIADGFPRGVKDLIEAKKLDTSKQFSDKANKLISDIYIKSGFEAIDDEMVPWGKVKNEFDTAIKYWGASRTEIYEQLMAKAERVESRDNNPDKALKIYELAEKYEK